MSKKIRTFEEYLELSNLLETAQDTLRSASTQGAHFILIAFLRKKYSVSANGREEAIKLARNLLDEYNFLETGTDDQMEYYAALADKRRFDYGVQHGFFASICGNNSRNR